MASVVSPATGRASRVLAVVSLLALAGCGVNVREYADREPVFDMATYFNGPLEAWGTFQNRRGEVVRRFYVTMEGRWDGDIGTLEEHFEFDDGTTQQRTWTFTRIDEHRYTGTAGDVVGEADGEQYGNALRWRYTLELPVDDKVYKVRFDDWMYLMDDQVMLNQSVMKKFGVRLGEVTLWFRKLPQNEQIARS